MTKIPLIAVILASLLAATPGLAGEKPRALVGMGLGANSCQQFAEGYRDAPALWEGETFSWAQGFMSATNLEHHHNHQPLKNLNGVSLDDQRLRLRRYCDRHPLGNVVDAVWELYDSMPDTPDKAE